MLKKIQTIIQESEAAIVGILVEFAPWLAPIAPAYMAYENLSVKLQFNHNVSLAVAITVELLGVATVNTALLFWRHNLRYKDPKRKSPTWIPFMAFVFYLVIILSVNALLDLELPSIYRIHVLVKVMLTLLSVPAAITVAVRTQHTELLADIHTQNAERRAERSTHERKPTQDDTQDEKGVAQAFAQDTQNVAHVTHEVTQNAQAFAHNKKDVVRDGADGESSLAHTCAICGNRFEKQQQLAAHLRVHTRNTNGHKKATEETHPIEFPTVAQ